MSFIVLNRQVVEWVDISANPETKIQLHIYIVWSPSKKEIQFKEISFTLITEVYTNTSTINN